jgi:hypothetical protein
MIAAQVGVSHPTVAKAREGLSTGNNLPVERTVGLDGKERPRTGTGAPRRNTRMPSP